MSLNVVNKRRCHTAGTALRFPVSRNNLSPTHTPSFEIINTSRVRTGRLSAQTQTGNQFAISRWILAIQVFQVAATLANQLQQAAP